MPGTPHSRNVHALLSCDNHGEGCPGHATFLWGVEHFGFSIPFSERSRITVQGESAVNPLHRGTRAPPGRCHSGFTLLELLVVLAIAAILAGLAAPPIAGTLAQSKIQRRARSLMSIHRAARMKALSLRRAVQIHYDLDASRIRSYWYDASAYVPSVDAWRRDGWRGTRPLPDPSFRDAVIHSVGSLSDGHACVVFTPAGTLRGPFTRTPSSSLCNTGQTSPAVHLAGRNASEEEPCSYVTLRLYAGNAAVRLLPYGAYGRFPHRESRPPSCTPEPR